jgi:hypothetical protein
LIFEEECKNLNLQILHINKETGGASRCLILI